MTEYGTMNDFDSLVNESKKRNMKLMIDVVINHTSDQNEWFIKSKSSKDNPYRDYYFWRDPKEGAEPNNYPSFLVVLPGKRMKAPINITYIILLNSSQI